MSAFLAQQFKGDGGGLHLLVIAGTCMLASLLAAVLWLSSITKTVGSDVSVGLRREEKGSSSGNLAGAGDDRVLSPTKFSSFTVAKVESISHNTKLIRFEIPATRTLGLPIGRHISVRAEIDGNMVIRAYTPTSRSDTTGHFDLLVKSYEMGKLSTHLHALKPGDSMEVRGPVGRFKYVKNAYSCMGFVGGGTGLTPCLQVIRCILEGPEGEGDKTNFILLFQNRTEADILLRQDLEDLAKKFPTRLHVVFLLSNPSNLASGDVSPIAKFGALAGKPQHIKGYVNAAIVKALLTPSLCLFIGICGPSGFNDCVKDLLTAEGHELEKSVFVW